MNSRTNRGSHPRGARMLAELPQATPSLWRHATTLRPCFGFRVSQPTSTATRYYVQDPTAPIPDDTRLSVLREQLQKLALLQVDWNGYGAPAPAPETVTLSQQLLALASAEGILPHTFFPEPAGGVGATFLPLTQEECGEQQSGIYATIGFENDSSAALMIADRAKQEIDSEDILASEASLRAALRRIKHSFKA